jgi:outer membrane receptor protein involved in Fe transport
MQRRPLLALCGASILWAASATPAAAQEPATEEPATRTGGVEEIIVTAQKREENINDIGMSIQAATGDQLAELGVTDVSQLDRVVAGFNANVTYYGTHIYTIRGVGFQDTALASGPTVSIYLDQMPLPFSAMTSGVTLDLQRVEALKGPQGTLFGQNATGGAVNYIANKPTQEFEAGFDASYGRFNTVDLTGYVSGPITETLAARFAANVRNSGPWQKSYTRGEGLPPDPVWTNNGRSYRIDNEHGDQEFYNMRGSIQFDPTERLSLLFTASGFIDKGDSQMPQLFGIATLNQVSGVNQLVADYAVPSAGIGLAPHNNRAADWGPCVNLSGGSPADVTDPNPIPDNASLGEENLANRLYDRCRPAERDNTFYSTTLRVDFDLTEDITLTSLTSWSKFDRDATLESDGTIYQDYESWQRGYLKAAFQELRLAGSIRGEGNWVVGANYEYTSTWDSFIQTYGISSAVPTYVPNVFTGCPAADFAQIPGAPAGIVAFHANAVLGNCFGLDANSGFALVNTSHPLGPTNPYSRQTTDTYAFFANLEYPVLETVTLQGGVRYTNQKRDNRGCGADGGDGTWADISREIQRLLQYLNGNAVITSGVDTGPGTCPSTGPPPLFIPEAAGFRGELDQDNVSWRVGANWNITPEILAYLNVSQGYKSGSFPTVATAAFNQLFPAKQEDLLAYEVGGKVGLFDGQVQVNGAFFYYDYTDKQILGAVPDPIFGSLPALVNVPESHVIGFELSPILQLGGLRVAPSVSYAHSEIDGFFRNFDAYFNGALNGSTKDFSGEPFPNAPKWQFNLDTQYEFPIGEWTAFIGANLNYQSKTRGFFYDRCNEPPGAIDPIRNIPVTCTDTFLNSNPQNTNANGERFLDIVARALLDVRAGVERGPWRVYFWGRNVTNTWYWNQSQHVNDVLLRFTGMPVTYGITVSYKFNQ